MKTPPPPAFRVRNHPSASIGVHRRLLPPLGITLGDPAGIGPEITLKALARLRLPGARLIGPRALITREAGRLGCPLPPGVTLDDTGPVGRFRPGRADPRCGAAALAALERGVELLRQGGIRALVTAPVSKTALRRVGFRWPGQTEFLAERLGAKRTAMLAWTPRFKVVFVTIHRPLAEVSPLITAAAVAEKAALLHEFLAAELGRRPRIGVMAFNPHGEEFSRGEEARIAAGVSRARELGIAACGPFPADALAARPGGYDGYVAMYHDQAMIPAKLLGPGVNVTLGLGAVRTSPLHGTAFDIAGRGVADPGSMLAALRLARRRFAPARAPAGGPGLTSAPPASGCR